MQNKSKVLVTDAVHPLLLEGLEAAGLVCEYKPQINLEVVQKCIANYVGLIINSKIIVDKKFLDDATQLKFIGRLGSGMEIVDKVYAAEKGVHVFRSPEGNCNAVAEHALGMLLALMIHLRKGDREVRTNFWNREANRGIELMGRTIGLIGFGHTGRQFAQKLSGMGVTILAYDKYQTNYATDIAHVEESTMQTIFEQADILSLHIPLTEETQHLVNTNFIQQFKKKIILINTSRGGIVDTQSLVELLENQQLIGACLDVFENEKPATFTPKEQQLMNRLYALDQVLLTPHVAGWTKESKERLAKVLLNKILAVLK